MVNNPSRRSVLSSNPNIAAAQEEFGYADIVVAGDTYYFSGIVAWCEEGESIETGFVRMFERFDTALKGVGLAWQDVVAMDTFHIDLVGQSPTFREVKNRYMQGVMPAWTAVGTTALARPNGIAEMKLTAWRRA